MCILFFVGKGSVLLVMRCSNAGRKMRCFEEQNHLFMEAYMHAGWVCEGVVVSLTWLCITLRPVVALLFYLLVLFILFSNLLLVPVPIVGRLSHLAALQENALVWSLRLERGPFYRD